MPAIRKYKVETQKYLAVTLSGPQMKPQKYLAMCRDDAGIKAATKDALSCFKAYNDRKVVGAQSKAENINFYFFDKKTILDGHQRIEVADELNMSPFHHIVSAKSFTTYETLLMRQGELLQAGSIKAAEGIAQKIEYIADNGALGFIAQDVGQPLVPKTISKASAQLFFNVAENNGSAHQSLLIARETGEIMGAGNHWAPAPRMTLRQSFRQHNDEIMHRLTGPLLNAISLMDTENRRSLPKHPL